MINGRPNLKNELNQQQYLAEKIQPVVSQVVMEVLETKPRDPISRIYNIVHRMTEETKERKLVEATKERGPLLTDAEWEEYQQLQEKKKYMMAYMHDEIADLDSLIQTLDPPTYDR